MTTRRLMRTFLYVVLVVLAVVFTYPFLVLMVTSFKHPTELVNTFALPSKVYLGNYTTAVDVLGRGLLNSLIITVPAVMLSTFLGALAAYPLSHARFKNETLIYFILLGGLFIPPQIVLVPLLQIMHTLKAYDTFPGLWLVHGAYGIPFCTFYLRNYFATIPRSLFEAALIDGCSVFGYFYRVLLPLSMPGIAVIFILQARGIWNDVLFGLTLTRSKGVSPVSVGLMGFITQTSVQYGPLMAATVLTTLPVVVTFLIFRKQFIEGMLSGSLKG